ncbi:MAG: ABC transporter ATP-binding protein [Candidatus Bipolaricaulia bacterium]
MAEVELIDVTKRYKEVEAVSHLDLEIEPGEFFSLLGPSGCGKTTTLRLIAGFARPTGGTILIQGKDMTGLPPEKRDIGIVFQNYAIFPHMNVFNNIAFGLRLRKLPKKEIETRVHEMLERVGLVSYEGRYQRELSGGEQQRVALARVLVTQPRILLLDEPLSALDKKLRDEMKFWLKDLQHQLHITTIYVTHDQSEALIMSDRLAVMDRGQVDQVGTPHEIYEHPSTRFVTDFIGESNILAGRVKTVNQQYVEVMVDGSKLKAPAVEGIEPGQDVSLVVRPENVQIGDQGGEDSINRLRGEVTRVTYQGALIRYEVQVGEHIIIVESPNTVDRQTFREQDSVEIGWHPESSSLLLKDLDLAEEGRA